MTIADRIARLDNVEIVRDQIAAILKLESASQVAMAASVAATVTRADDSDYTAVAAKAAGARLEEGNYVATAGTLVAGVGTWTCSSPSGQTDQVTTEAADDDLVFSTLGVTFTVTAVSEPWDTGDVLTVWSPDPELARFRVYKERIEPWGQYLQSPELGSQDACPIVNVSFDQDTFDESQSDGIEIAVSNALFNVDVYGYGVASAAPGGGQVPADVKAGQERDRAARLVRSILMAGLYYELGLVGTVARRFIQSRNAITLTDADKQPIQQVRATRLVLGVKFDELSPQVELLTCSAILTRVHTEADGEVVFSVEESFGD
jgi:hypothetical protein